MPNSFYRFQPAWNAGFYPDNQITSNLLNTVSSDLATYLPTIASGISLGQFRSLINTFVNQYNVSPYFGDLSVSFSDSFCFPFQCYYFSIRNNSLFVIDNTQSIDFVVQFNLPDLTYSAYTLSAFTPGSYTGTFDYPAIPVEGEVDRALQIVEQNGSAFFPLTYSFNSGSNIAISGLARGKNWQLDSSGNPTRLPADTLPKQNARTFSVAPQTSEDRYCISLMEKVMNFSFTNLVATEVRDYFNSFTIPDGWTRGSSIVAGTYERIYLNLYRDDRSLLMIGRLDTTWLWQRFLDDSGTNDISYFNGYASTTPLPYLPLLSYQWLYGEWYDMEFVEFNSDCYESKEFYAMPAIPGDNWQFNVPSDSGNLTNLTFVSVGLFTQDGQFIQNVGESIIPLRDECTETNCTISFSYTLLADDVSSYLDTINSNIPTDPFVIPFLTWGVVNNDGGTITLGQYTLTVGMTPLTMSDIVTIADGFGISVIESDGNYDFSITISELSCSNSYYFENYVVSILGLFNLFETEPIPCICDTKQLQATILIPSVKNGCYRLGLYTDAGVDGFYLYSLSNIINIDSADCFSTMIEFWANDNSIAQGNEYFNNWKQRVRIGLNGGGEKPKIEESMYRQSNGVHRRPQNKQDLSIDLHTDFFDLETQLAMTDATRHPYLVWNGQNIFVTGDIEVATIQDFTTQSSFETLSQMKFQALKQGFQPKNSSCITC
jgi:hypothetical protein